MKIEPNSDTWRTVESWATGRLTEHRKKLEANGGTELAYAQHRARIAELKALLDLPAQEHA